jgi:hypothetical protein
MEVFLKVFMQIVDVLSACAPIVFAGTDVFRIPDYQLINYIKYHFD